MKYFKLIGLNFVFFLVFLLMVEIFFQANSHWQWLKISYSYPRFESSFVKDRSEALKEFGESVLQPIPESIQYHPDERLAKEPLPDRFPPATYTLPSYRDFEARRGKAVRSSRRIDGTDLQAFDVLYQFNEFGRRRTEYQDHKTQADRFVFAFGCSFTLGEGLDQGKDYPSLLASKLSDRWKVYNFGFHGMAPNDSLDEIRTNPSYTQGIHEKVGVFVWLFIPAHMDRLLCPFRCYGEDFKWILGKTQYSVVDGLVQPGRRFVESLEPKRLIYSMLWHSAAVRFFGLQVNSRFDQEDYDFFARSLDQIIQNLPRRKVLKKYVIVFHPPAELTFLRRSLKERGFEVIEFFNIGELVDSPNLGLVGDGHPSSNATWYLSEMIKNRIDRDFAF